MVAALGFTADLGPLADWGLNLDKRHIIVDSTTATNLPRVFAAGDISEYPGKVRLIAVGFGEAATAVNNAAVVIDPSAHLFPGPLVRRRLIHPPPSDPPVRRPPAADLIRPYGVRVRGASPTRLDVGRAMAVKPHEANSGSTPTKALPAGCRPSPASGNPSTATRPAAPGEVDRRLQQQPGDAGCDGPRAGRRSTGTSHTRSSSSASRPRSTCERSARAYRDRGPGRDPADRLPVAVGQQARPGVSRSWARLSNAVRLPPDHPALHSLDGTRNHMQ